ncbi:MAG: hypothetical protein EOO78_13940 [Oxalobacteraceae bacterium]|nr:MAG: hypothetical protein EOO78_13940 [Oxalobacteraceae bacterium]
MHSHHAFERFRSRFASLPTGMARGMEAAWTAALDAALADDDLVNFDARLAFELALARLLAEGWQPGHEALFPTAAKRLGWDRERRTLARLGMVGELLDLALDERLSFFAQDAQARAHQRQVLSLLRAAAPCRDRRILAAMFEAAGGGRASRQEHGPGRAIDAARATVRYEEGLSRRQIDEIASRIAYRPGPHADLAKLRAGFDVLLDETGRVVGVEHKETAADPAFTAAVEGDSREQAVSSVDRPAFPH